MHTAAEVATTLKLGKVMKEPERFLVRQVKAGKIRARKVGRHWMFTDEDIAYALERFANPDPQPDPQPATAAGAPSAASMRRRRVA